MDNEFTGRVCPYCSSTIQENNVVKICPACGIPHHRYCWDKNGGCTTSGCPEESNNSPGASATFVCKKCGAVMEYGQDFCPKCGQKAGSSRGAKKSGSGKIVGVIIGICAAVAVAVAAVFLVPKVFVSVEKLCEQGNYIKAYEKADDSEKMNVKAESIAAEQSAKASEMLKNPSSFVLREAYYLEDKTTDGADTGYLALYISGTNGYGAVASSYWLFMWDTDDHKWDYFDSVSSLTKEDYNSYDSEDELTEKYIDNLCRDGIKYTMSDGVKLNRIAINRINTQFENGTLDNVEAIPRA